MTTPSMNARPQSEFETTLDCVCRLRTQNRRHVVRRPILHQKRPDRRPIPTLVHGTFGIKALLVALFERGVGCRRH